MLHRRILLDGAIYLRQYRPELRSADARVNEGRRSYAAGLAQTLASHLGTWLPEEPKPCPVLGLPVRVRKSAPLPSTPPRFALGERQNGQTFFYWQEPPAAPLYFFPERSR